VLLLLQNICAAFLSIQLFAATSFAKPQMFLTSTSSSVGYVVLMLVYTCMCVFSSVEVFSCSTVEGLVPLHSKVVLLLVLSLSMPSSSGS